VLVRECKLRSTLAEGNKYKYMAVHKEHVCDWLKCTPKHVRFNHNHYNHYLEYLVDLIMRS